MNGESARRSSRIRAIYHAAELQNRAREAFHAAVTVGGEVTNNPRLDRSPQTTEASFTWRRPDPSRFCFSFCFRRGLLRTFSVHVVLNMAARIVGREDKVKGPFQPSNQ